MPTSSAAKISSAYTWEREPFRARAQPPWLTPQYALGVSRLVRTLSLVALLVLESCGAESRQRIVLVTIDTWRADALEEMPAVSEFLARGVLFEHAYSASSTTQPTHASLLTGLHPWQHGVTKNGEVLPESCTTLAERLKRQGFATGAVVASFPLGRRFGYARGFDRFHDEFQIGYSKIWAGEEIEGGRFYSLCEAITDQALVLLEELEGPRQFLWIHYFDAHDPYGDASFEDGARVIPIEAVLKAARTGPESAARSRMAEARACYERDLQALDRSMARLLARLDEQPPGYETHVVITADHGESLGELGCIGHGKRLVREQVQVPLGIVSPRLAPSRRDDAAGSVDVTTTLLSLAGSEPAGLPGRDLLLPPTRDARALGMRSNFGPAKSELLLDGTELSVEGARFYVARGGRLLTGDREQVLEDDDPARPLSGPETEELRAAFAGFATLLEGTSVETLAGDEVNAALRAMGYAE